MIHQQLDRGSEHPRGSMVDLTHRGTSTWHLTSLFYQETGKGSKVHTRRTRVLVPADGCTEDQTLGLRFEKSIDTTACPWRPSPSSVSIAFTARIPLVASAVSLRRTKDVIRDMSRFLCERSSDQVIIWS
jgi:hypothetical protein